MHSLLHALTTAMIPRRCASCGTPLDGTEADGRVKAAGGAARATTGAPAATAAAPAVAAGADMPKRKGWFDFGF